MAYIKDYINNKIKGTIAEQIFELMHIEIGCQIFRTGQEFLYPNLFANARFKKKVTHIKNSSKDNEKLKKDPMLLSNKNPRGNIRFEKKFENSLLAANPDFTIITSCGNIIQFEVKYRSNGILSNSDKQKYLNLIPKPYIFVMMNKEPYFKILIPSMGPCLDGLSDDEIKRKVLEDYKKHQELEDEALKNSIPSDITDHKQVMEHSNKIANELAYKRNEWYYKEAENKDGSFTLSLNELDDLIYPKKVLDKYQEVIKKWFESKKEED